MIAGNTIVGNRYRVVRPLDGGAMKQVYLAEDARLSNRPCALAEMIDSFANPEAQRQAVAAFQREADILAGLSHEHIVRIYDQLNNGNRHYLVMEYVPGVTLEDHIAQSGGKLGAVETTAIAMQILDAFEYLHSQTPPVIYRDLKPSNVILMPNGRVKLIDFGIARLFKPEIRGTLIGTPGYASPEQYRGSAEPQTDLYALGALMHFMLTGRDPSNFEPFSFPLTRQMLPSLNPLLAALVDEALAEKIGDRVGSAGEFRRRLQASNAPAGTGEISSSPQPSSVRAERQCPQCTRIIPADASLCPYCGTGLAQRRIVALQTDETIQLRSAESRAAVVPQTRRSHRAVPLLAMLIAIAAAVSAAMFIYRDPDLQARLGIKPLIEQLGGANREHPTEGSIFRDCPDCPQMVVVPAGSFTMGAPASDRKRDGTEGPQHRVTINQDFAVGVFPVTRDEYGKFVTETNYAANEWRHPSFAQTDKDPVVNVNWFDAKAYAAWLSQKTGHTYHLLSESEYEYAQRASTTTAFWWGDDASEVCSHANGWNCGHAGTVPVGSYPANAFGLYDIAGNVWEWTEDCWNSSYEGAPVDGTAWTAGDCGQRVLRGGSQWFYPAALRSANRFRSISNYRTYDLGFRVARIL